MDTTEMLKIIDGGQLIELLQSQPTLLTTKDTCQRSLLHWCCLNGQHQYVEHLLSFAETAIDEADDSGYTPLMLATLKGHMMPIKLLIQRGANVNHQNTQGHPSLQYACSKGWPDVMVFLLECGANVNAKDTLGDTSLHRLASLGRIEMLSVFLCQPGLDVDAQNGLGCTALHVAAEDNVAVAAMMLVQAGASIEVENKAKLTPFDVSPPGLRRKITEWMENKNTAAAAPATVGWVGF